MLKRSQLEKFNPNETFGTQKQIKNSSKPYENFNFFRFIAEYKVLEFFNPKLELRNWKVIHNRWIFHFIRMNPSFLSWKVQTSQFRTENHNSVQLQKLLHDFIIINRDISLKQNCLKASKTKMSLLGQLYCWMTIRCKALLSLTKAPLQPTSIHWSPKPCHKNHSHRQSE